MIRRLALTLALFLPLAATPLDAQQGRKGGSLPAPDVAEAKYGPHERNVLSVWQAKSDAPTPLVVFIHGGGFRAGSKEQLAPTLLSALLEAGISVASINYRLSQHAPFPAPMHDGGRAVQFLRAHAQEWNLDPARFGATGGSAGAGISLWLAFHEDRADPKSDDPVARESTRLTCAVGTAAQTSYDPRWIQEHIGGRAHEHPALQPFYGLTAADLATEKAFALFAEASPLTHYTKDDPPVLLLYGGDDPPGDKPGAGIHSEKFGFALREAAAKLELSCEVRVGREAGPKQAVEFFQRHLQ